MPYIMKSLWFLFVILISIQGSLVQSAKILLYPGFAGSHIMALARLGQELAKRDHEVTILVASTDKAVQQLPGITYVTYDVPFEKDYFEKSIISMALTNKNIDWFRATQKFIDFVLKTCDALLSDKHLLDTFKDFNLVVADRYFLCGALIAARLGIRRVDYGNFRLPYLVRSHESIFSMSYLPYRVSTYPTKMTFLQRVANFLRYCLYQFPSSYLTFYPQMEKVKIKYGIMPDKGLYELLEDVELTLLRADFTIDNAQPLRPDQKVVGSLNLQPVRPLPSTLLQELASSGEDGAILVSFGSAISSIVDKDQVDIMVEAFGKLKQKVFWRLKGYIPKPLPSNILIHDWLPQNDLLANQKLRAFVSHVGSNSMYEALYHGVPVLAMPLFGDQFYNAIQMEERGVTLIVDHNNLTVEGLYNAVHRVIYETSFRQNAQRISRLMIDRARLPVEEAGDWVEYTLRHKDLSHLRPQSSELAWYQYFLVDVALFLVLSMLVVLYIIKCSVRFVASICCKRAEKQKTQ